MVKLYALSVLRRPPTEDAPIANSTILLKGAYDLASFGFFQRASIQEFMVFASKITVERTSLGSRRSVKEQDYICHCYVRIDGLSAVLVSDSEYPHRVAHTLLTKVMDDVSKDFDWKRANVETMQSFKGLDLFLAKYQNPNEADSLSRIQADLDETKIIMTNTIEAVLERGEKIDDLVAKSEGLSASSKLFYKTAKKTNSCCNF